MTCSTNWSKGSGWNTFQCFIEQAKLHWKKPANSFPLQRVHVALESLSNLGAVEFEKLPRHKGRAP